MQVEQKILSLPLNSEKLNIIVAGDSRAERQIIPQLIEDNLNCNCINIATPSCDLITAVSSIRTHFQNSRFKILVIMSVSSFQINDGAIDDGYISLLAFSKLTYFEKIMIFKNDLFKLRGILNRGLNNILNYLKDKILQPVNLDNKGFLPIYGIMNKVKDKKSYLKKHPWYKDIHFNGSRNRILQETLDSMGLMSLDFLLIQPPISPHFQEMIKNTQAEEMENNFSILMKNKANNYSNLRYLDFYTNGDKRLGNHCYYDPQHLNITGANIFTNILINELQKSQLLQTFKSQF